MYCSLSYNLTIQSVFFHHCTAAVIASLSCSRTQGPPGNDLVLSPSGCKNLVMYLLYTSSLCYQKIKASEKPDRGERKKYLFLKINLYFFIYMEFEWKPIFSTFPGPASWPNQSVRPSDSPEWMGRSVNREGIEDTQGTVYSLESPMLPWKKGLTVIHCF